MQVLQFLCCKPFQAPPRKRFQPHRWQIADWWSATPHQCLIFCSCFFLVPILFSFSFSYCSFFSVITFHLHRRHSNMQCCPYWYDSDLQQHAMLLMTDDLRRHSNIQYCPYWWYDRCLQQHAMLLMTDDPIGSPFYDIWQHMTNVSHTHSVTLVLLSDHKRFLLIWHNASCSLQDSHSSIHTLNHSSHKILIHPFTLSIIHQTSLQGFPYRGLISNFIIAFYLTPKVSFSYHIIFSRHFPSGVFFLSYILLVVPGLSL